MFHAPLLDQLIPMRRLLIVFLSFFTMALTSTELAGEDAARRADLDLLLERLLPSRSPVTGRMNPHDTTWEEWAARTGELPPDFEAMPSNPWLPDPLKMRGTGVPVTTPEQWEEQRAWIRSQIEHWIFGTMPPAPDNLRVAESRERRKNGLLYRDVLLEFGPDHRAKLNLQLIIPPGEGPHPVFLTNHAPNRSFWVNTAVSRGYIACFYQATDPMYGLPDDSDAYIEIYPDYDFSCLGRWAWAGSRAVDYLVTLPEVIPDQIGLTGHSRNGKQALLAAAFDDRIGAVAASSGLTGEAHPWRHTADPFVVESIQLLVGARPYWFQPRLRFFTGREHKLPVDQNMLMALIAPRGQMIYSAFSESSANAFSLEQGYRSVREVYRHFDREENLWLHLRDGEHGTEVGDVENFMDFFDAVFNRKAFPKKETWIFGYDFDEWKTRAGAAADPADYPVRQPGESLANGALTRAGAAEIRERVKSMLGEAPPAFNVPLAETLRPNRPPGRNPLELVFGRPQAGAEWRDRLAAVGMGNTGLSYGPGLSADVFYPVNGDGAPKGDNWPVVIWLHPYAHAQGWSAKDPWNPRRPDFVRDQRPQIDSLVRRGFAVVAFDQIGFGSRAHEARTFYDRYPNWSLMGKMVADTRAVIDAVSAVESFDSSRIFLLGYSLGAKVGLFTTAFENRVEGVVAVSGATSLRLDRPEKGTEGLRHYSHLHGLLPKLGFFLGEEARVPFDYDDLLALSAPARVLVVAPELDRYSPVDDVREMVRQASPAFEEVGAEERLELWTPRDFNRFPRRLQEEVFDHLANAGGLRPD